MAFLGCSSPARAPDGTGGSDGEGYDTVTSDVTESTPKKGYNAPAAPEPPCSKDAGTTTPTKSCKEIVASAFPDAGWVNPGQGTPASDEVKACCTELLTPDGGFPDFPERWACCDAVDAFQGGNQGVAMACTPWGPPTPPAMRRRPAKPPTPRPNHDAWLEVA